MRVSSAFSIALLPFRPCLLVHNALFTQLSVSLSALFSYQTLLNIDCSCENALTAVAALFISAFQVYNPCSNRYWFNKMHYSLALVHILVHFPLRRPLRPPRGPLFLIERSYCVAYLFYFFFCQAVEHRQAYQGFADFGCVLVFPVEAAVFQAGLGGVQRHIVEY